MNREDSCPQETHILWVSVPQTEFNILPSPQLPPTPLPPSQKNSTSVHLAALPRSMEVIPHIHPNPQVHLILHQNIPQTHPSLPLTQEPLPLPGYCSGFLSGPDPLAPPLSRPSSSLRL